MMNRQIRVEKIIGTVKLNVSFFTCGAIEIQPVKSWNSSAFLSFLTYSVGAVVYVILQQQ